MFARLLRFVIVACSFGLLPLCGSTINVGLISFDNLIPGAPGAPGVNVFSINNFTGNPGSGGFAVPPDFPIFTSVILQNVSLTLAGSAGPSFIPLSDLGPGSYTPNEFKFPETTTFSSAIFTATLNTTVLSLSDGTVFSASSSTVVATLLPSSGLSLGPGVDFVLVQISGTSSVPEPSGLSLFAAALGVVWCLRLRRRSEGLQRRKME